MRDPAAAVRFAERAVALTARQDPNVLDVLASALAAAIRERRDLYRSGRFYRLRG